MPLTMVRNDITAMQVDAIVNAANCSLKQGGGVCGAIFRAAGEEELSAACDAIGFCPTGQAVVTPGFRTLAKWIIHTPGPVWSDGNETERAQLSNCYTNALALATEMGCRGVAFPLISAGIYGCPKEEALSVAVSAISAYLLGNDDIDVWLTLFDSDAYLLGGKHFGALRSYIDDHYAEAHNLPRDRRSEPWLEPRKAVSYFDGDGAFSTNLESSEHMDGESGFSEKKLPQACASASPAPKHLDLFRKKKHSDADNDALPMSCRPERHPEVFSQACMISSMSEKTDAPKYIRRLEDVIGETEETFSKHLLRLIDTRGKTDVEVYKRANIDRKLFSKIRSDPMYQPSKRTAIALALALELNLDETTDLLKKAGFALSPCSRFDIIVQYFVENGIYDVFRINEALFVFDQNLLGA